MPLRADLERLIFADRGDTAQEAHVKHISSSEGFGADTAIVVYDNVLFAKTQAEFQTLTAELPATNASLKLIEFEFPDWSPLFTTQQWDPQASVDSAAKKNVDLDLDLSISGHAFISTLTGEVTPGTIARVALNEAQEVTFRSRNSSFSAQVNATTSKASGSSSLVEQIDVLFVVGANELKLRARPGLRAIGKDRTTQLGIAVAPNVNLNITKSMVKSVLDLRNSRLTDCLEIDLGMGGNASDFITDSSAILYLDGVNLLSRRVD